MPSTDFPPHRSVPWSARSAILAPLMALVLLAGCAPPATPETVADRFWRAMVAGHGDKARRWVRSADRAALQDGTGILPVTRYELGRIEIDAERARVETRLELGGDAPLNLPVATLLVKEEGDWRVDYAATVAPLAVDSELARVMGELEQLGATLGRGVERSMDELARALPRIETEIERFEQEMEQRLPALREKVDEFSRQFEEALREKTRPAPPPAPPPPSQDAIEI